MFCNSCKKDEQFGWVCGDDIACENINNAQADDSFDIIRLAPSDYCKVIYCYGNEMTGEQAAKEADDYFWNEWLKGNPYKSPTLLKIQFFFKLFNLSNASYPIL